MNAKKNPKITEKEIALIKRAKQGEEKAFNIIFKKYKGFVASVLNYYLRDKDEAKDLTNIVFLKVHDKLSTFTTYDSFGGWLRVISNRTAIDYLREKKNKIDLMGDDDVKLTSDLNISSNENDLVNHITYEQIIDEFEKLPESTRKVFELFYINNLTVEQISKRLSMPKGTIKSILSRTRRKLQKQFKNF